MIARDGTHRLGPRRGRLRVPLRRRARPGAGRGDPARHHRAPRGRGGASPRASTTTSSPGSPTGAGSPTSCAAAASAAPAGAVVIVDLDDLKYVNDSLGHAAGDALLRSVSAALSATLRPGEFLARFGGDEFTVLLDVSTEKAARRRLAAILRAVRGRQQLSARASCGAVLFDRDERRDRRGPADRRRHRDARGEGARRRPLRDLHRRRLRAPRLGRPPARGDRRRPARPAPPADLRPRQRRARRRRDPRADGRARRLGARARRLPADRRALRPDPRDRPLGDRRTRSRPPRRTGRSRSTSRRARSPIQGCTTTSPRRCGAAAPTRPTSSSRSPRPRRRPRARSCAPSAPGSSASAARWRSTTSAPASARSPTSSTCRSAT